MIKKISAFLLAITIATGCFASCSDKDEKSSSSEKSSSAASSNSDESSAEEVIPEPSLTIDGKKVDTKDLIVCTVDGHDIDFETFRYYYFYTLENYKNYYGITLEAITQVEDGFKIFMNDVIGMIKQVYVGQQLADENGIKLTDEDKKNMDKEIKSVQSQYHSEEEYISSFLKAQYLTENSYKKLMELSTLSQKVNDKLFTNGGKYATSEADFKKIVQNTDEYARVIHILIPYECQAEITDSAAKESYESSDLSSKSSAKKAAYQALSEEEQAKVKEKSKKLAEDVLNKAKSGEDFEKLVKEYGWDPGMEAKPEGYYMNKNSSYVQEFKDASFKLKANQISGLVENTTYGWFIIKRLPVDMKYVEENIDSLITDYDTPKIQKIYTERADKMKVEYDEIFDKITADSIT